MQTFFSTGLTLQRYPGVSSLKLSLMLLLIFPATKPNVAFLIKFFKGYSHGVSVLTHIPLNSHHNHPTFIWKKNSGFWNYFSCENFQGSPNDPYPNLASFSLSLTLCACLLHLALVTTILLVLKIRSAFGPMRGAEPMVLHHFTRNWVSAVGEAAGSNSHRYRGMTALPLDCKSLHFSTFLLPYNLGAYMAECNLYFYYVNEYTCIDHGEIFFSLLKGNEISQGLWDSPREGRE